jgi:hypothetical protein
MSWAVYAMTAPAGARSLDDVPPGYTPPSLGTADEVVGRICEAAPQADASDPRWLKLSGEDYTVEITVGKGVDVRDVTFYLDGPRAVGAVLDLAAKLGVTAYDTESGERLTASSAPPVPPPLDEDELPKRRWWRRNR